MESRSFAVGLAATAGLCLSSQTASAPYDPLAVGAAAPPAAEFVVHDEARSRDVPLLAYRPADAAPAPVVLFSHGLGGSNAMGGYLGRHWAARGYVAVFLQHPGSDDDVWRDERPARRRAALTRAASLDNFLARVRDVPAVVDQLAEWNADPQHPLFKRLDLDHVGMSGHSFGAVTTQAVSGQAMPRGGAAFAEPRIKAALPMSPSSPRRGSPAEAFGKISIPWLVMTGTNDTAAIGGQTVESRLAVFDALPPGDKYELVLDGAEHSAFTDRPLPGDRLPRNPNHHRAILALSTAFWDAYLRQDAAAKAWLASDAAREALDEKDQWEKK